LLRLIIVGERLFSVFIPTPPLALAKKPLLSLDAVLE
jgi:hypothetical protein